jgi:hypothetical protein
MPARLLLALVLVPGLLLAGAATAAAPAPPRKGVVVEGRTFGGLPLGLTEAQVRARWGRRFGICDNCLAPTWYYTFHAFQPQGIGIQFRRGRSVAYFTLGAPQWRTGKGLAVGDTVDAIRKAYGNVPTVNCTGYQVEQAVVRGKLLLVYMDAGRVYGLGLSRPDVSPCR